MHTYTFIYNKKVLTEKSPKKDDKNHLFFKLFRLLISAPIRKITWNLSFSFFFFSFVILILTTRKV